MIDRDEIKKVKSERHIIFAALLFVSAMLLITVLLVWNGQITGMQTMEVSDHFCVDYSGFDFVSEETITLSASDGSSYQLKLNCIPGNITFHDNSDIIDVSREGVVKLITNVNPPEIIDVMILAEHESSKIIYKKFRVHII